MNSEESKNKSYLPAPEHHTHSKKDVRCNKKESCGVPCFHAKEHTKRKDCFNSCTATNIKNARCVKVIGERKPPIKPDVCDENRTTSISIIENPEEEIHHAPGDKTNPIHQHKKDGKWYFSDEIWVNCYGPFDSEQMAIIKCQEYMKDLMKGDRTSV